MSKTHLTTPEDLFYSKEHVWLRKIDERTFIVGISDFAQDQLGEILFVDMPEEGSIFKAGQHFGEIESLKSVSELYMPIDGIISAVNDELEDNPTLVNETPYNEGWIIKLTCESQVPINDLLSASDYKKLTDS